MKPPPPHSGKNNRRFRPAAPRRFFPLRGESLEARALLSSINIVPVALSDAYVTQQDALLSIAAPGVLLNDTDSEDDPLIAAVITEPTHGILDLHADGGFTYAPFANYSGPDRFTYRVNDGQNDSSPASVEIVVNFVPDSSVAAIPLGDINVSATSQVQLNGPVVQLGALGYFSGYTTSEGLRLWQSDGTFAGTMPVGSALSMPGLVRPPVRVNNLLFFSASDNESTQLWKSDGTLGGTARVKVIRGLALPSNPSFLTNVSGTLFFVANDGSHGAELWKSDGTTAGTVLVKDILPGTISSGADSLVNINGTLFFTASDGTGTELWKSDGTALGTVPVKGFAGKPHDLVNVNGKLFFVADDGLHANQLWMSDGSPDGTGVVRQLQDLPSGPGPSELTNLSGTLVFVANDGTTGYELWKTDGTDQGTTLISDINPGPMGSAPAALTDANGMIFFQATDGQTGRELWKSNGTAAGTVLLRDLVAGSADSNPTAFAALGSGIVFAAQGDTAPTALWKTDGTTAGTSLVKDVSIGLSSPFVTPLSIVNGALFFNASDEARGVELWKSDGTTAGTAILRQLTTGASLYGFHEFDGLLYFSANDGVHGDELWRTDGTETGTSLFTDLNLGTPHTMISVGKQMYFKPEKSPQLWVTDGTPQGTTYVRSSISGRGLKVRNDYSPSVNARYFTSLAANVNGTLFFGANDGSNGYELWMVDGTSSGAVLVKDIPDGGASLYGGSFPNNLVNVGGTLFFEASDNEHHAELWKSDGTELGTVLVKDIRPGIAESNLHAMTNFNGKLIFTANDGVHGQELWASDGTEGGTVMLKDIESGANSSVPSRLTVSGNLLFFLANDITNGYALWKTDGTSGGTTMVKAFGSRFFDDATDLNGKLYFTIYDSTYGRELWTSDGTTAGTHIFRDINPGPPNSSPSSLSNVNGRLYFRANDGTHGTELWFTDGTAAGTQRLTDMATGIQSVGSPSLVSVLGRPVFLASDGIHGGELWSLVDVNGVPVGANTAVTAVKNRTFTFHDADFGFSDPTDTPPNTWAGLVVVTLPAEATGKLTLAGKDMSVGQAVLAEAISAGQLQFVPAPNTSGIASFAFGVRDDGGTANGGADTSATQTATINVLNASPWYNAEKPLDVDGDSFVAPSDALTVINYINAGFPTAVAADAMIGQPYGFVDVNGDGLVATNDALVVINAINAGQGGEGEADGRIQPPTLSSHVPGVGQQEDELLMLLAMDISVQVGRRRT